MWFHQQNEQRAEAARQMSPWEAWPRVLEERTSLSRVWQARSCHPSVVSLPSLSRRLEGRASPSKSTHRIYWASPTGTVAWGRPPICSSLMPVQKLEMLLAGGLVFKGDSLFKKGTIGRKSPHGQTPRKALAWIVSITLALSRGAGNVTPRQPGPCVCLFISVTQCHTQCLAHHRLSINAPLITEWINSCGCSILGPQMLGWQANAIY